MRLKVRTPNTVVEDETEGMDETDIAAVNSDDGGYDAGDPNEWPEDVKTAARENWEDGPEAFDAWVATFD